jgi:hypothetical protein
MKSVGLTLTKTPTVTAIKPGVRTVSYIIALVNWGLTARTVTLDEQEVAGTTLVWSRVTTDGVTSSGAVTGSGSYRQTHDLPVGGEVLLSTTVTYPVTTRFAKWKRKRKR